LHQQKVDLVAIHIRFRSFLEMPVDQGAQAAFACVQRRCLQQLAKFMHGDSQVHLIQPGLHLVEQFQVWLLRQIPLFLWKRNLQFELLRQSKIDWENRAILNPLCLPGVRGL
jgi:hypothetical protein